jgi:glutamine synthetase
MQELARDEVILEAIGREFCDYYINFKLQEWSDYHNTVSPWETDKYLTLY